MFFFTVPLFESVDIKLRGMAEKSAPHAPLNIAAYPKSGHPRPHLSGFSPEEANVLRLSSYQLRRYFL
jgi:hypothetical protein